MVAGTLLVFIVCVIDTFVLAALKLKTTFEPVALTGVDSVMTLVVALIAEITDSTPLPTIFCPTTIPVTLGSVIVVLPCVTFAANLKDNTILDPPAEVAASKVITLVVALIAVI